MPAVLSVVKVGLKKWRNCKTRTAVVELRFGQLKVLELHSAQNDMGVACCGIWTGPWQQTRRRPSVISEVRRCTL